MAVPPSSAGASSVVWVPASRSSRTAVAKRAPGSDARTFSVTMPRPLGTERQASFAPCAGQSGSRRSTRPKPSTNVGQRATSVQSSNASPGGRATTCERWTLAIDLAHDLRDRLLHRVEERTHVGHQAAVLLLAFVRQRVVAPAAALRVLPAPLDQAALLELAEQGIH